MMSHRIVTRSSVSALSGVACLVESLWRRVRQEFQELPHASVVLQGRALHFETVFNLDQSIPFWIRRTKFSTCSKEARRCLELRCYPAIQVPGPRNGTRCR